MTKIHLVSFGAPYFRFKNAHKRFFADAKLFNKFSSINIFSEKNIYKFCKDIKPYKDTISNTKGYGYWIWKYFLISEMMNQISQNDIILYADIGCTFNRKGSQRFDEYIAKAKKYGALTFKLDHEEFKYTKKDTFIRVFGNSFVNYSSSQRLATTFFLVNNKFNKSIIEEVKSIGLEDNFHFISDSLSSEPNHKFFVEHRHDQSIFSLISKKYNLISIKDETFFRNWNTDGIRFPIWATRNVKKISFSTLFIYYYYKYFKTM